MLKISKNKDLKNYNTFNLSCIADKFIEFDSVEDIKEFLEIFSAKKNKYFVLGGGSNVLFSDKFNGSIFYSQISGIELVSEGEGDVLLKIGSGVVWDGFVKFAVDNNYYGTENLSLIPGTVGASAVQNIGAYGAEAKDIIEKVEYLDIDTAELKEITNKDCNFAYRDSIFKNELHNKIIITHVYYRLQKQAEFKLDYGNLKEVLKQYDEINLKTVREAVIQTREAKLPDTEKLGNAGSFFKNPVITKIEFETLLKQYPNIPHYLLENEMVKIPAGWLIDNAGWKNKGNERVGVCQNQALVIVNKANALSNNIVSFYKEIQADIFSKYKIRIEPEVIIF